MTPNDIDAIVKTVIERGDLRLKEQERGTFLAIKTPSETVLKLLAADAFNRQDGAAAVQFAKRALEVSGSAENQANYVSALRKSGRMQDAITYLTNDAEAVDPIRRATWLGEIYATLGNPEQAREWGRKALERKDTAAAIIPNPPSASKPTDGLKVIAFSLWGNDKRYIDGALRNAIVANHLYPGWTPRFYVDSTVPDNFCKALVLEGAQVHRVGADMPATSHGLFWRFLVEDDPAVATYIVRDADSVLSVREWAAVQEWLNGDKPFHVMRDWLTHCELILAGMWGAHRGNLPQIRPLIDQYLAERRHVLGDRARDQKFLAQEIWPYIRNRTHAHDSQFGWGDPFPAGTELPGNMHVGQNDNARRRNPAASATKS